MLSSCSIASHVFEKIITPDKKRIRVHLVVSTTNIADIKSIMVLMKPPVVSNVVWKINTSVVSSTLLSIIDCWSAPLQTYYK